MSWSSQAEPMRLQSGAGYCPCVCWIAGEPWCCQRLPGRDGRGKREEWLVGVGDEGCDFVVTVGG